MITTEQKLKNAITEYRDFPKPGIVFRDLNPLYKNPQLFSDLVDESIRKIAKLGTFDYIAGIESRGFFLGVALAMKLGIGFIPVRKKGKLPGVVKSVSYQLEYGSDSLEIQTDAELCHARILIVDDVFATGGTIRAVISLLQPLAKETACALIMDIGIADRATLPVKSTIILP